MEVSERQGILEAALRKGFNSSQDALEDTSDDEENENDENWGNVLPVEVNIDIQEENAKPLRQSNTSDTDSDFYGFENGLIPVKEKARRSRLSMTSSRCPHCSYKTRRKDHFKRHVLRHPEQTLYPEGAARREKRDRSCSVCGYTTSRLDHFKRHVMRHTGEKPYACFCGYSTTHGIHLKRHISRFNDPLTHYPAKVPIPIRQRYANHRVSEVPVPKAVLPEKKPSPVKVAKKPDKNPKIIVLGKNPKQVFEELASRGVVLKEVYPSEVLEAVNVKTDFIVDTPPTQEIQEVTKIKEENIYNGGDLDEWSVGVWPPVEVKLEVDASSESEEDEENKKKRKGRPHICKDCGYSTMRGDHFKRHLMRHTGEKPYSCTYCDYKSTHAIHLKRHMSTHTDDRPFRCEYCPFRAIRPHHLRDHVRLHTGERPYVCNMCGYSAAQSGNYRAHMRTHYADKPHVCEICGYSTVKSSNLVSHMRTHTGETGHPCGHCSYRAIKPSEVARHILRVHGIQAS